MNYSSRKRFILIPKDSSLRQKAGAHGPDPASGYRMVGLSISDNASRKVLAGSDLNELISINCTASIPRCQWKNRWALSRGCGTPARFDTSDYQRCRQRKLSGRVKL